MVVKARGSVKAEPADRAVRTEIQWLIDRNDGAPNFELRKFRIRHGGSIPKHFHPEIEHEQYVLSGDYRLGVDDKVYRLRAGDSVFIPSKSVHWYVNDGPKDAEFLCIIPKVDKYETVYLEEQQPKPRAASTSRARRHR